MILRTKSGKSWSRHGRRNLRARRETVQGAGGQAGHDVRVADGGGEAGVNSPLGGYFPSQKVLK